jgi:hypothetical protein
MRAKKTKTEPRRIEDILNNSKDKAVLQNFLDEAVRCKVRISDEQESIKAMREEAMEKTGIEGKMFNALLALFYNNNFDEKKAEIDNLETAIELLTMNKG